MLPVKGRVQRLAELVCNKVLFMVYMDWYVVSAGCLLFILSNVRKNRLDLLESDVKVMMLLPLCH